MKKEKVRFYVEKQNKLVQSAVVLMLLSAVFRIIGCWSGFSDKFFAVTQIALPLSCNLLFILVLMLCGKRFFSLTAVPVVLGVLFFIIKATGFDSWLHMLLCILLYIVVALLYCATVFGVIPTKWPLVPLFALPFLYHVCIEDVARLKDTVNPMSFSEGMQEMSVLCIMLSLLCTALAMKKKKPAPIEEQELPKIKDPKPIVGEQTEMAAEVTEKEV
ncbi:MAG: hypothetical protein IJ364_07105 [Oscillospiraceae bacterium]|nr:hypothetical protein [Oscillospiraceae bacterium]